LALSLCFLAPPFRGRTGSFLQRQLLAAARQGDLAAAKRLLDGGAAVNSRNRWRHAAPDRAEERLQGHGAARVERGANVNLANLSSVTPLMAASFSGSTDLVKILLEKGADRSP